MTKQTQKSGEQSSNIQVGGDLHIRQEFSQDQIYILSAEIKNNYDSHTGPVDKESLMAIHKIQNRIYVIRGQRVMLDSDLAELYQVETRILNRNVNRNIERFPDDFRLKLTYYEMECLRKIRGEEKQGRRALPHAYTELGVAMMSSVLNSKRAILTNVQIMRAFKVSLPV